MEQQKEVSVSFICNTLMLAMLDRLCSNLIIGHVLCECASVMLQFGIKMFLLWQAVVVNIYMFICMEFA